MSIKISLSQAKERLKEAHAELYYPKHRNEDGSGYDYGVRSNLSLKERIFLFEEIEGLRIFLKNNDGKRIPSENANR